MTPQSNYGSHVLESPRAAGRLGTRIILLTRHLWMSGYVHLGLLHEHQVHVFCICAFTFLDPLNPAVGITLTSSSGKSDCVMIRNPVCLAQVYHWLSLCGHGQVTLLLRTGISSLWSEGKRSVDVGHSFPFHIAEWNIFLDCLNNVSLILTQGN